MKNIRTIIREELVKILITNKDEKEFSVMVDELNGLLNQVKNQANSGESQDYIISKINTILLGWQKDFIQ